MCCVKQIFCDQVKPKVDTYVIKNSSHVWKSSSLTLYEHIKTQSIIQQYGDWYTGHWWYIWYSEEGPGQGHSLPRPLLAVPDVTAHPSTASVLTSYHSMWHYCLCTLKG